MKMIQRLIATLSALTGILLCASTLAADLPTTEVNQPDQPPTYQIEMIVFSHITEATLHSEKWPAINPQPIRDDFAFKLNPQALTSYLSTTHFYPVPTSELQLNRMAARINRNANYKVLLHYGWQQQFPPSTTAQPIHLYSNDTEAGTTNSQNPNADHVISYDSQSIWPVDGEVAISLNRFFNIKLNLLFSIPTNQLPSDVNANTPFASSYAYFHLIEKRRMRSKELNYIDSPLFSIIIKITPVKDPLSAQTMAQAQPAAVNASEE